MRGGGSATREKIRSIGHGSAIDDYIFEWARFLQDINRVKFADRRGRRSLQVSEIINRTQEKQIPQNINRVKFSCLFFFKRHIVPQNNKYNARETNSTNPKSCEVFLPTSFSNIVLYIEIMNRTQEKQIFTKHYTLLHPFCQYNLKKSPLHFVHSQYSYLSLKAIIY